MLSLACCRELESSSRVPGSESRHRVFYVYAAFDLFTTCDNRHLSVRASFKRSTRSGSASTTKPNTMPPTNSRRCYQVMPAPMSIAETITSSVAILFFKMVLSFSVCRQSSKETAGAGLVANPWPGVVGTPAKASHGNPASTFPHELRIASTYVMRPCCRL